MSSYFPLKTLWRSYFCALVATGVLAVGLLTLIPEKDERALTCDDLGNESIQNRPASNVPGAV